MMQEAAQAIESNTESPNDKHVHVSLKTSALCREMGGTVGVLCKSGSFYLN